MSAPVVKRTNTALVSWSPAEAVLLPPLPPCPEIREGTPLPLVFSSLTLWRSSSSPDLVRAHVSGEYLPEGKPEGAPALLSSRHLRGGAVLTFAADCPPEWLPVPFADLVAAYLPPVPVAPAIGERAPLAYIGAPASTPTARLVGAEHRTVVTWPEGAPVLVPSRLTPFHTFRPAVLDVRTAIGAHTRLAPGYLAADMEPEDGPELYTLTVGPGDVPEDAPADVLALVFTYQPTPVHEFARRHCLTAEELADRASAAL